MPGLRPGWPCFRETSNTFTISGSLGLVCVPTQVGATAWAVNAGNLWNRRAGGDPGRVPPCSAGDRDNRGQGAGPRCAGGIRPGDYRIVVTNAGTATVDTLTVTDTVSPVIVGTATDSRPDGRHRC